MILLHTAKALLMASALMFASSYGDVALLRDNATNNLVSLNVHSFKNSFIELARKIVYNGGPVGDVVMLGNNQQNNQQNNQHIYYVVNSHSGDDDGWVNDGVDHNFFAGTCRGIAAFVPGGGQEAHVFFGAKVDPGNPLGNNQNNEHEELHHLPAVINNNENLLGANEISHTERQLVSKVLQDKSKDIDGILYVATEHNTCLNKSKELKDFACMEYYRRIAREYPNLNLRICFDPEKIGIPADGSFFKNNFDKASGICSRRIVDVLNVLVQKIVGDDILFVDKKLCCLKSNESLVIYSQSKNARMEIPIWDLEGLDEIIVHKWLNKEGPNNNQIANPDGNFWKILEDDSGKNKFISELLNAIINDGRLIFCKNIEMQLLFDEMCENILNAAIRAPQM